jgi:hypothetical protein
MLEFLGFGSLGAGTTKTGPGAFGCPLEHATLDGNGKQVKVFFLHRSRAFCGNHGCDQNPGPFGSESNNLKQRIFRNLQETIIFARRQFPESGLGVPPSDCTYADLSLFLAVSRNVKKSRGSDREISSTAARLKRGPSTFFPRLVRCSYPVGPRPAYSGTACSKKEKMERREPALLGNTLG